MGQGISTEGALEGTDQGQKTVKSACFSVRLMFSIVKQGVNVSVTVERGDFLTREEATAMVVAAGLHSRDGAMESGDLEDVHWHKTSLKIYLLSGTFETKDVVSDQLLPAGPGDIISIPEGTLHAARCPDPTTYVVGFESEEAMKNFRPEAPETLGN